MADRGALVVQVELIGGFNLTAGGEQLPVAPAVQRLLSLLAMRTRPISRSYACGVLWPDVPEARAAACLRSALWRVPTPQGLPPVCASSTSLSLASSVEVDLHQAAGVATAVVDGSGTPPDLVRYARTLCEQGDLLPGCYEDWVAPERERFRQLRLHALDCVGELLLAERRYGDALQVALAAIAAEPLRETGHRLVVRVHLAEGNVAEALRHFRSYAERLAREVGLGPSREVLALCREHLPGPVEVHGVGVRPRLPLTASSRGAVPGR